MKFIYIFLLLIISGDLYSQNTNVTYNKAYADSLGADDYGMKKYLLVILKTGKTVIENKPLRDSLFKGHMDNIARLAKEGKLVIAGPIDKNAQAYRGIFIFNIQNRAELDSLLAADPTIKSGIFDVEIFDWYGSAALPTYLPNHDKVQKVKF